MTSSFLALIHRADQNIRAEMADVDATPSQILVLRALKEHGKSSQNGLVERTSIDRSTMADMLRRLEARGLVSRTTDKEDARAKVVEITREGSNLLAATSGAVNEAEQRILDRIPAKQRETFLKGLERIAAQ